MAQKQYLGSSPSLPKVGQVIDGLNLPANIYLLFEYHRSHHAALPPEYSWIPSLLGYVTMSKTGERYI
jgi:hypothetical protein